MALHIPATFGRNGRGNGVSNLENLFALEKQIAALRKSFPIKKRGFSCSGLRFESRHGKTSAHP
jgi:hypothetical protein